jgi:hypothetical protein
VTAPSFDIFDAFFAEADDVQAGSNIEVQSGRNKPRAPLRGYAPWRPRGDSEGLLAHVDQVLTEYAAYLPLSIRQIFYRLVGVHGFEKSEAAYNRLVYLLGRARRAERIAFDAIRDDGVVTMRSPWHESPEDFWDAVGYQIRGYRRDRQAGQRQYLELWCEAAGMLPQLARVTDDYSVPVYSAGGFASLTAVQQIAERACSRNVPTVLLHVGDFDPSGESIFTSMAEDAAAFVDADRIIGTSRIVAERVALTVEQVAAFDLPTAPAKQSDSRSTNWTGGTCQLEALPPDQLAQLVGAAIEDHFDMTKWREQVQAEELDRTALLRALPRGDA